jgi:hypothetical protein
LFVVPAWFWFSKNCAGATARRQEERRDALLLGKYAILLSHLAIRIFPKGLKPPICREPFHGHRRVQRSYAWIF